MKIWYVSLYEPLPINGKNVRKMRTGWICDGLLKEKNNVELWIPGFDHLEHKNFKEESVFEELENGLSIQYIKGIKYKTDTSIKRIFHHKCLANEFKKIANSRNSKPDLIITQIPCLELAEAVIKFANKNKIPSILDIRDLWPDIYKKILPNKLKWAYKFIFFREILRLKYNKKKATEISAISQSYLSWAEKHSKRKLNSKNIFYIGYKKPPSKNFNYSWEDFLYERNIPIKKKYIIFSGTFCKSYDFSPIIKASEILKKKNYKDYYFLIAGKGELPEDLLNQINNSNDVHFLGWLNQEELSFCLKNSHVGLAPYSKDALMSIPNKFFEYLAYGLPIISSLNSEMKILIKNKKLGYYYKSESPESLAKAIISLEKNFKNELFHHSIKKEFDENFDGKKIYKKFAKFTESILK